MPQWGPKPEDTLQDALDSVWNDLSVQIADNPEFSEVVGIPIERLLLHATTAVKTIIDSRATDLKSSDFSQIVQIYCLGFVVGTKYGERLADHNHNTMKETDDI